MADIYDVEQLLITESGRIGADIHQRTVNTSPYLKLVKQGAWPDEMGKTITVLTFERSLPVDDNGNYIPQTWSALDENLGGNDGNGNCNPTPNRLNWGQSTRTYSIDQTAIESPDLCVNDLRHPVHRKAQLSAVMRILTDNTKYIWVERFRDEYTRLAEHKIVCFPDASGNMPEDDTAFPALAANSQATRPIMKRIYQKLNRDGAGDTAIDRENNRPVYVAIMSSEQSENLLTQDSEFRQDVRYSNKVNDLLSPLGVERSYDGFFHLIDDFAPRWDFVTGSWVRRYPYKGLPANARGQKLEINEDYEDAHFEDIIIFHPDVFTNLVPGALTSPGGATKFDPVNYRGDFKWKNIPDRENNPDGTIGYFRGVFQCASEPKFPQWGYVLRVLRCGIVVTKKTCSQ